MSDRGIDAVTGAFGFSGRSITRRLLAEGRRVRTLTNHPKSGDEFEGRVDVAPLNFDDPAGLTESLRGVDVLYNTYWIRFNHGETTHDGAVENSRRLIQAARDAGVRRMVHVSIIKPSIDSRLSYYRGKALVEQAVKESGLSYAILRPAVLFGDQGILINNIAWFLKHLPVFGVPGNGEYKLQPIHVDDQSELAVAQGASTEDTTLDATGPEIYTFNELLKLIGRTVHSRAIIIHMPADLAFIGTKGLDMLVGDVVLTRDEIRGLMDNLLVSDNPPTGHTLLSTWLAENAAWLGTKYMSEVSKHYR